MRFSYFDATVYDDTGEAPALKYRKSLALLFYLASLDRAIPRSDLTALFWPDASDAQAKNNLRVVLADVRKHLGDVLDADRRAVRLRPGAAQEGDLAAFEAWARHRAPEGERPEGPDGVAPILPGLTLPDAPEFDGWVDALRERTARTAADAWTAIADADLREGRDGDAIQALHRALACRPSDEATHRRLIRLYAALGRRDEALAQVDACRLQVSRQLEQPPSAALDALAEAIGTADVRRGGMVDAPPAPWGVVGRTAEILEVERAFVEGDQRAVVVAGAPGMGASTVAWAAARVVGPRFLGGVRTWSARDVPDAAALADGLKRLVPNGAEGSDLPTLALVDDVPHLAWLDAVLPHLLGRAPAWSLLVTGRGPADDVPATVVPVRALRVPPVGREADAPSPAVRLAVRAARAAGAHLEDDVARDPRLARAVRRSGGHPLTLVGIGTRLAEGGLAALEAVAPDVPVDAVPDVPDALDVHDAFAPALALLDDASRATLARLAVFHGPVERSVVRRVTGLEEAHLAKTLRTLGAHHLLETHAGPGGTTLVQVVGGLRTDLHRALDDVEAGERAALEDVGPDDAHALRDAHADWVANLVSDAEAHALGHEQQRTFARLERLLDDVDAALAHLEATERTDDAIRIAASAWRFHDMAGRHTSALARLERLLDARACAGDPLVRSDAENARGSLYLKLGQLDRADAAYRAGLALREAEGDPRRIASSLNNLAVVQGQSNAFADAAATFQRVIDTAVEGDEPWVAAAATVNRGHALTEANHPREALDAYREGAGRMRRLGDLHGRLGALLGVIHAAAAVGEDALVASTVWEWLDAAKADGGVRDARRLDLPAQVTAEKLRTFGYPDLARRLEQVLHDVGGDPPPPGDGPPDPDRRHYRT